MLLEIRMKLCNSLLGETEKDYKIHHCLVQMQSSIPQGFLQLNKLKLYQYLRKIGLKLSDFVYVNFIQENNVFFSLWKKIMMTTGDIS